jgi:hypothetical protein
MSCPTDESAAATDVPTSLSNDFANQVRLRVVSDDGSTAAFTTSTSLVPGDRNAQPDVYEWHDGHVSLLTDGTSSFTEPTVAGMTPDGHDILFKEITTLTSDATDRSIKLYDARIDGGFPAPQTTPACAADQCRGPLAGPPSLANPSSDSTAAGGNVKPTNPTRLSLPAITAGQRAQFARTGRMTLRVRVSRATTVSATASAKLGRHVHTVAHASKRVRKAGTVPLRLRLSSAARQRLAHGATLHVSLRVRAAGGSAGKLVRLTLKPRGGGTAHRAVAAALVTATADGR